MIGETTTPSLAADGGGSIDAHLELLADMGRDFAASLDIDATLARALERITEHLDGEGGALFLLDETGETLRCEASSGISEITGLTLSSGTGIVGRCVQGNVGEMVRDVAKDSDFFGGVDAETGVTTRSILCAPMSVKDERIGAIEIINKRGGDGLFDAADLNVLQSLSTSAALAVLNARMAAALVEQERVKRELELAAEIQRSLLPPAQPAPFPIQGINHPARTVSGDFYDFFTLADGRVCFNLGDVSGKGMNAALLMAKTASLFRCLGKTLHDPGRLLGLINAEICETVTRGMFVTMAAGIFDPATGRMRLANAGHEPPLHHTRDGAFKALEAEAPPLGISTGLVADDVYPETEFDLDGGTLYIFTDGVTEGYLEDGTTFEVEGLKATLAENGALTLSKRLEAVVGRVKRGEDALRDDLTILGVEDVR
jgi:phosphoserine phosphatase RsbU/P